MNSLEQSQKLEDFIAGLMRSEPLSKENALEYIRFGKKMAENGNIIRALAEEKIKENLKLYSEEQ